jgi:hypothetical protein
LHSIDRIVHEAACPVITVIDVEDRSFVNQAAQRGGFAYVVTGDDPQELQSSIDIVLRRFREYHALESAFGRRATTERAKGALMERHRVDEAQAFEMLRREARRTQRKLVDVAAGCSPRTCCSLRARPVRKGRSGQSSQSRRCLDLRGVAAGRVPLLADLEPDNPWRSFVDAPLG